MEFDHDAARTKRASLEQYAAHPSSSTSILDLASAKSLVDAFADITPPELPGLELITINSLYRPTARSRKPGNLLLNWRKLMDIVPDVTLASAGAVGLPVWAIPLAALYVWNKVWRGTSEEFTQTEATIILALWKNRNGENRISEDDGFSKTNSVRTATGLSPLTRGDYIEAIDRLIRIQCIELTNGIIWLREWIRVKYGA
jgi:hypothetical protein